MTIRDPRIDPLAGDAVNIDGQLRRVILREGDLVWCQSGNRRFPIKLQRWQKWCQEGEERHGYLRALQTDVECAEATRLLTAYNKATLALSFAVQHLLNGGGILAGEVYATRRRAANIAREEFESARLAYETYIQEHHCEGGIGGGGTGLEVMFDCV